jgi:hypothetical protein
VEDTTLSPAPHRFITQKALAACPEPTASAAAPPSIAAKRVSSASQVGFMMRV